MTKNWQNVCPAPGPGRITVIFVAYNYPKLLHKYDKLRALVLCCITIVCISSCITTTGLCYVTIEYGISIPVITILPVCWQLFVWVLCLPGNSVDELRNIFHIIIVSSCYNLVNLWISILYQDLTNLSNKGSKSKYWPFNL